jgi:hypothetical protein
VFSGITPNHVSIYGGHETSVLEFQLNPVTVSHNNRLLGRGAYGVARLFNTYETFVKHYLLRKGYPSYDSIVDIRDRAELSTAITANQDFQNMVESYRRSLMMLEG